MLVVIILLSVAIVIALLSWALSLFVTKYLHRDLGRLARWLVGLLVLQFILGMAANLFQSIPKVMPWRVFHVVGPIALHALNAFIILVFAIWLRVIAGRKKKFVVPTAIGGIAVAVAFACGVTFVNFGQNDVYSYVMSLGFLVAILEYAYIAFRTQK